MKFISTILPPKQKFFSIRFWIAVALALIFVFIFIFLADKVVDDEPLALDDYMFQKISLLNSTWLTKIMTVITFFGSKHFLVPAYVILVLYFLFGKKDVVLAITIGIIRIVSKFFILGSKVIFKRIRPEDPIGTPAGGFSFPSGHAISSFTFFGLLIYLIWSTTLRKVWKIIISLTLFLCACTIAFSRVYLRVHYATDVLAGICVSSILLIIILGGMHKLKRIIYDKNVLPNL